MSGLRNRSAAFLLLVLAACRPPAAPAVEPEPARIPLSEAAIASFARIVALEDAKHYDDAAFRQWLGDADPMVRSRAALGLGRVRDARGAPLLRHALDDPAPEVRADAAFALGQLADTAAAAALRDLLRVSIDQAHSAAAVEAAGALGKLGTATARRALEDEVLRCPDAPAGAACPPPAAPVLVETLLSVWRIAPGESTVPLVAAHATARDRDVRWAAVYALFRLGGEAAVPLLISAASDNDPLVRATAVRGLRASLADSANARAAASAALTRALADPHPHVRINAARTAPGYGGAVPVTSVLSLLADRDANVVLAAADALAELADPAAAAGLTALAESPNTRLVLRAAAIAALLAIDPQAAAPQAHQLARSGAWLHRLYAARLLARMPGALAGGLAAALARDADPRVAATAISSLAVPRSDTIPGTYALYLEALAHPDHEIRAAALRGLEARADPADLPHLLEAYARAMADPVPLVTLAAVDALAALARAGVPVERSFFVRFQRHPSPLVRARVAATIGDEWGPAWPQPTAADHQRLVRDLAAPVLAGQPRPRVRIRTAGGDIVLELAADDAPRTVANFLQLAALGYFDGARWHRVVPNFVLQDGDPRGAGSGGPGWAIRDEINRIRYRRGILGMALAGPDTGGSQFFITHAPQPHLDGGYTVFGRVIEGMDVADAVVQDDPIHSIELLP